MLRALVEKARAEVAAGAADELAPLRGKALAVLEKALDAGDLGAAKALLGKLVAGPAETPPQDALAPEPGVSVEDALRELTLAIPAAADLARLGQVPPDVVATLRDAARLSLADDLLRRPLLDVEAERVEATGA